mmetsp:Transcript_6702/g.14715  ORF Transcript_6702/g.14715 Transcript_6702/m.14715 type:complete len:215 (-) Transcript_6702:39-683(-)
MISFVFFAAQKASHAAMTRRAILGTDVETMRFSVAISRKQRIHSASHLVISHTLAIQMVPVPFLDLSANTLTAATKFPQSASSVEPMVSLAVMALLVTMVRHVISSTVPMGKPLVAKTAAASTPSAAFPRSLKATVEMDSHVTGAESAAVPHLFAIMPLCLDQLAPFRNRNLHCLRQDALIEYTVHASTAKVMVRRSGGEKGLRCTNGTNIDNI